MSNSNGFKSVLAFEQAVDRRLPAHYSSYHIGRLLLITGSVTLLSGLLLKFIFYEDRVGPIFIVTLIICGLGVALFLAGAFSIIFAARKSVRAQDEFAKQSGLNQPTNYQSNLVGNETPNGYANTNNNNNTINGNYTSNGSAIGSPHRPSLPLGRSISQTIESVNSAVNHQSPSVPTLERVDSNPMRH